MESKAEIYASLENSIKEHFDKLQARGIWSTAIEIEMFEIVKKVTRKIEE